MQTKAIELVRLLLQVTRAGQLTWLPVPGLDRWEAAVDDEEFAVEFIYLARTDGVGADRTIARLYAFQLALDYSIGTEGMDLLCEMLSVGDQEWAASRARGAGKLANGLTFLRRLKRRSRKPAKRAVAGRRGPRSRSKPRR